MTATPAHRHLKIGLGVLALGWLSATVYLLVVGSVVPAFGAGVFAAACVYGLVALRRA